MPRHRYVMRNGKLEYLGDVDNLDATPRLQVNTDSHYEYDCPITGKMVTSRYGHKENLKKHNCRIFEKGESDNYRNNFQKERDQSLRNLVDRILPV